jgi:uncharacterized protein (DUF2141 family)
MFTYDAFSFIQVTFLAFIVLGFASIALQLKPRPDPAPARLPNSDCIHRQHRIWSRFAPRAAARRLAQATRCCRDRALIHHTRTRKTMTLPRRLNAAVIACAAALTTSFAASAEAQPAAPPPGCTGKPSATWINVVAQGLRNGNGMLAMSLYEDKSSQFLVRHGALYTGRVEAVAGTTRACIFVPRSGVYALALYHDENANRHFDRSGIGLPTEGYGFSNNPPTLAGLPSFRSVRLSIPRTGMVTRVQMKYP